MAQILGAQHRRSTRPRTARFAALAAALAAILAASLIAAPARAWEDAEVLSPGAGVAADVPGYVVQARVFDDEAAARALVEEFDSQGVEAYVFAGADTDGAFRYSVRLGVFDTLYEAMQAVLDLSKDRGIQAEVAAEGSFTPMNFADKVFIVQVVALSKQDNLDAILEEYRAKGFSAGVVLLYDNNEPWYIVHVGGYGGFAEAEVAAEDFRRSEARPCYVIMMDRSLFESRSMGSG